MKKIITAAAAVVFVCSLSVSSAHAGSGDRIAEGIIIGTGLGILGATIVHGLDNDRSSVHVYHQNSRPRNSRYDNGWRWNERRYDSSRIRYNRYQSGGYWEVRRVWVEPVYREVWVERRHNPHRRHWNSGHYDRRNSGRYDRQIVREGYYKTERVWVSRY